LFIPAQNKNINSFKAPPGGITMPPPGISTWGAKIWAKN